MRLDPLRCFAALLLFVLSQTSSSTTRAQETPTFPPPPLAGGMAPPGRQSLLLNPAVQSDLALTDKQKSQISGFEASLGQKRRALFQAAQENGADPQEFQEAEVSLQREFQASLTRVLDKTQKTRLSQIELQREGFLAASRSEIATKLKLTSAQTKQIKTIVGELRRDQAKALPGMLGGLQGSEPPQPVSSKSAGSSKTKKGTSKFRRPSAGGAGGNDGVGEDGEMAGGGSGENGFGNGFGGGVPGGGPPGGLPDFLKPENQADYAKIQEAMKKSREVASAKIGEVLTAGQKTAFE
jgi:hypothetical protein